MARLDFDHFVDVYVPLETSLETALTTAGDVCDKFNLENAK